MACLVAPAAAAVAVTLFRKKIPAKYHIDWLNQMLWGGTIMLIVDHILSGEIVWYFPFFSRSWSQISHEVLKVGVPMTMAVFVLWIGLVILANVKNKKALTA